MDIEKITWYRGPGGKPGDLAIFGSLPRKMPQLIYWSYGERLPVVEETKKDPDSINYYFQNIAALIAHHISETGLLVENRDSFVSTAIRRFKTPIIVKGKAAFDYDIFISYNYESTDSKFANNLQVALKQAGISSYRISSALSTDDWYSLFESALSRSQHLVALLGSESSKWQKEEIYRFLSLTLKEEQDRMVIPVLLDESAISTISHLIAQFQFFSAKNMEMQLLAKKIALRIKEEISWTLSGHKAGISAVAITQDGRGAISASNDGTLRVWDLDTWNLSDTFQEPQKYYDKDSIYPTGAIWGVALFPDGKRVISACQDGSLKVRNLGDWKLLATLTGHKAAVLGVAIAPAGRRAISASNDGTMRVWDLESWGLLATLTGHKGAVCGVAFFPDGKRVISASQDESLKIWDLENWQPIMSLTGHSGGVLGVSVTPDGRRAVSASYDKTLRVWDLETGSLLSTLSGHESLVNAVVISSDGGRAFSASADRTVNVWDLWKGKLMTTLKGHKGAVDAVAITPDGQIVVSASNDQTLRIWDLGLLKI